MSDAIENDEAFEASEDLSTVDFQKYLDAYAAACRIIYTAPEITEAQEDRTPINKFWDITLKNILDPLGLVDKLGKALGLPAEGIRKLFRLLSGLSLSTILIIIIALVVVKKVLD